MDARRHEVTTTAAEVLPEVGEGSALIRNAGSTDCYLGGSGVTSATGFLLEASDVVEITKMRGPTSAITASGSTTLHVLYGSGG